MTKRGNGEGTNITQHASGRWWQRVTLPDGTRKAFYGDTKKEVREKREEFLAAYRAGRISPDAAQRVSKYLQDWLKTCRRVKESTYADYERQVGLALPSIGNVRLDQLKPAHLQALYDELEERGLSATSIDKVHRVLRIAFRRAVKLGTILRTPTEVAAPPRAEYVERTTLTVEQARTLLALTETDRLHALWTVFLLQGLRLGEALGLRWSDIDFDEKRLSIRHTVQRIPGKGLVTGTPKTAKSRRTLDLAPATMAALRRRQDQLDFERKKAGWRWESREEWLGLVFTTATGKPIDPGTMSKLLHRRLRKAGLPMLRVHDLRHTYATILNENGVDLIQVQHALGHSSYHQTANIYTHVRKDRRSPATEQMAKLFLLAEDAR